MTAEQAAGEAKGVVLQASYRVQAGAPVVHLYGKLESGETFLIRDHGQRPHFFIAAADVARATALGAACTASDCTNFAGEPVSRVDVAVPGDAPAVRDRLHDHGIDTCEADVRFAMRFLIDRAIFGSLAIRGTRQRGEHLDWIYDDPDVAPAVLELSPRVLSFDIETDADATRLLAISFFGCGADEVLIVDPDHRPMPEKAMRYPDEKSLLQAFCTRVRALDPDVLTGWNIIDFDLTVLQKIAQRRRHPFEFGRDQGAVRIRPAQGYFGSGSASVPGRLVLDGIDLLRGAFVRFDDFSLDAVSRDVLGEGKSLAGDVHNRVDEIMHNYAHDLPAFARYARTDARLAYQVVDRLQVIGLAFARSRLTGMTPDRVAASIASFDFMYLSALGERRVVAPSVRSSDASVSAHAGGYVLEPVTGVHDNVWVFDFKSLYPSIIRTFNIDPLGYRDSDDGTGSRIAMPGGAFFEREQGILPRALEKLFPRREQAKADGDPVASQAIKILMNSFYGVLGTPACRFHNPAIANAITGQGKHLLQWSMDWFEQRGFKVLYGDTDSLFIRSGAPPTQSRDDADGLARALTAELSDYVNRRWQVHSHLELEFEKLYRKLFLPSVRGGESGARKRYAGLLDGVDQVEFVGMEVMRRDWTELAKVVQRELYTRLFAERGVEDYLADMVARLRNGEFQQQLVYRKGLRKRLESYTATTPPHVVAARKSSQPPGRIISYVMTSDGPEPTDERVHPVDVEHYIEKQIRPVAEPVLDILSLEFEAVIGDDRQIGLF